MNKDYRIVAKKSKFEIEEIRGDDLSTFHLEEARLRSIFYMILIAVAAVTRYGWALQARTVRESFTLTLYNDLIDSSMLQWCF